MKYDHGTTRMQRLARQRFVLREILGDGLALADMRQMETSQLYDGRHHVFDVVDVLPSDTLERIIENLHGAPIVHYHRRPSGIFVTAVRWKVEPK